MKRFGLSTTAVARRVAATTQMSAVSSLSSSAAMSMTLRNRTLCGVASGFIASYPSSHQVFARRFCSNTPSSGSLPPAPLAEDATADVASPAAISSNAHGLSAADKEIVRQALEIEQKVRAIREAEKKELEEKAKALGKTVTELEKEAAESGKLLVDKDRKDQMGGQGIGTKHGDMMAIFTCNVCEHRSAKRFSKHCYTKGIVIVQCPGCTARHLLADNMGWFEDDKKNIEEILRDKGEEVVRLSAGVYIESLSASTTATSNPDASKGAV